MQPAQTSPKLSSNHIRSEALASEPPSEPPKHDSLCARFRGQRFLPREAAGNLLPNRLCGVFYLVKDVIRKLFLSEFFECTIPKLLFPTQPFCRQQNNYTEKLTLFLFVRWGWVMMITDHGIRPAPHQMIWVTRVLRSGLPAAVLLLPHCRTALCLLRSNSTALTMTRLASGTVLCAAARLLVVDSRRMSQRALPPGPSLSPSSGEPLGAWRGLGDIPFPFAVAGCGEKPPASENESAGLRPGVMMGSWSSSSSMFMIHVPIRAVSSLSHMPSLLELLRSSWMACLLRSGLRHFVATTYSGGTMPRSALKLGLMWLAI
ncbi:hypothetical protein FJTKL_03384 [Diaporthe vaccinii]|uniref:Uncharacterized protein n=1 Tax=Diaporthe vaccinii TaxID=105482 RepID=A0ABR4F1Z2_9PEZI